MSAHISAAHICTHALCVGLYYCSICTPCVSYLPLLLCAHACVQAHSDSGRVGCLCLRMCDRHARPSLWHCVRGSCGARSQGAATGAGGPTCTSCQCSRGSLAGGQSQLPWQVLAITAGPRRQGRFPLALHGGMWTLHLGWQGRSLGSVAGPHAPGNIAPRICVIALGAMS